MNRRLLYKFKIVRLYEDDIWGIFFRKQKKRDLFFRKIGYQLFLEIFQKNIRAVKPTFFAWNKKIFASVTRFQNMPALNKKTYLTALARKTKYGFFLLNYTQNTYNLASFMRCSNFYLYSHKPTSLSIVRWATVFKKYSPFRFCYFGHLAQNVNIKKRLASLFTYAAGLTFGYFKQKQYSRSRRASSLISLNPYSVTVNAVYLCKQLKAELSHLNIICKNAGLRIACRSLRAVLDLVFHLKQKLTSVRYFCFKHLKTITLEYIKSFEQPACLRLYYSLFFVLYVYYKESLIFYVKNAVLQNCFTFYDTPAFRQNPTLVFEQTFVKVAQKCFFKQKKSASAPTIGVNFFQLCQEQVYQESLSITNITKKTFKTCKKYKNSLSSLLCSFSYFFKIQLCVLRKHNLFIFFKCQPLLELVKAHKKNLKVFYLRLSLKQTFYFKDYNKKFNKFQRFKDKVLFIFKPKKRKIETNLVFKRYDAKFFKKLGLLNSKAIVEKQQLIFYYTDILIINSLRLVYKKNFCNIALTKKQDFLFSRAVNRAFSKRMFVIRKALLVMGLSHQVKKRIFMTQLQKYTVAWYQVIYIYMCQKAYQKVFTRIFAAAKLKKKNSKNTLLVSQVDTQTHYKNKSASRVSDKRSFVVNNANNKNFNKKKSLKYDMLGHRLDFKVRLSKKATSVYQLMCAEYRRGTLRTVMDTVLDQQKLYTAFFQKPLSDNKSLLLYFQYYQYWRLHLTKNTLLVSEAESVAESTNCIQGWYTNELKIFNAYFFMSKKRLFRGSFYITQLLLVLLARKCIAKSNLQAFYAFWFEKKKKKNLFYICTLFIKNIKISFLKKRHYILQQLKLVAPSAKIHQHILQRLKLVTPSAKILQHILQRLKLVTPSAKRHQLLVAVAQQFNKKIAYTSSTAFYLRQPFNAAFFKVKSTLLQECSTKYKLKRLLRYLPIHPSVKSNLIMQWFVCKALKVKARVSRAFTNNNCSFRLNSLLYLKRLSTNIRINIKYATGFAFFRSSSINNIVGWLPLRKFQLCKHNSTFNLFLKTIAFVYGNTYFFVKNKKSRRYLNKTRSLFALSQNTFKFLYFKSSGLKNRYRKKFNFFFKNFKQKYFKYLILADQPKLSLFFRLLAYSLYLTKQNWHQCLLFIIKRLRFFKFSLPVQSCLLIYTKRIFYNFVNQKKKKYIRDTNFLVNKKKAIIYLNKYWSFFSKYYKILLKKKKTVRVLTRFSAKRLEFWKKYYVRRIIKRFNIKRYFRRFVKQQNTIFFTYNCVAIALKKKRLKCVACFNSLLKISKKEKFFFLIKHLYRYNFFLHLQNFRFNQNNLLFFKNSTTTSDLFTNTSSFLCRFSNANLNKWLLLLQKSKNYFLLSNLSLLLNFYVSYIIKVKPFFNKISFLPRIFSTIFTKQTLLRFVFQQILKTSGQLNNLYLVYDTYVYKKYKVYFYLFYKLWYTTQVVVTYLKFFKSVVALLKKQDRPLVLFKNVAPPQIKIILKNIFFRRFVHSALTFKDVTIFNKLLQGCLFFKNWFIYTFIFLFDGFLYTKLFFVQTRLRTLKRILALNKKNEFFVLRNLLNLYLVKWSVLRWKKFYYASKILINTLSYARRRVRRLVYALRTFFYQNYKQSIKKVTAKVTVATPFTKAGLQSTTATNIVGNNFKSKQKKVNTKNIFINKQKHKYAELKLCFNKNILFLKKTEYLLSFFASNHIYKYFNKIRRNYVNVLAKKRNNFVHNLQKGVVNVNLFAKDYSTLFNFGLLRKYSNFLLKKVVKIKKQIRFFSLRKRKTTLDRMFTLDVHAVVNFVKKKTAFNSFYKYRMLKVWKFRKFYGCLTNYELNSICLKAYKFRGDILIQFMLLLEARLDTILYRTGLVVSIFEARQLINHGNFLINNVMIKKRSYVLKNRDILSLDVSKIGLFTSRLQNRLKTQGLLNWPPAYLEVNYKYILIMFLFDLFKVNQIPYNFKLTGKDLNSILYYYY